MIESPQVKDPDIDKPDSPSRIPFLLVRELFCLLTDQLPLTPPTGMTSASPGRAKIEKLEKGMKAMTGNIIGNR